GQGWMNVRHMLLGQSASVTQPKVTFAPPAQAPDSQRPEPVQSPWLQHGVFPAGPPPGAHRAVSLTQIPPPGQEPAATLPQPPPPAQFAPGVEPPEQRIGSRSPSRNIVPVIGSVGVIVI